MPRPQFVNRQEELEIVAAIARAEKLTSGEIRVHIDQESEGDQLQRAAQVFHELKMHQTQERNGVLFHVSIHPKGFAVYGDEGIHAKVPNDFWEQTKEIVLAAFTKGNYTQGLISGIEKAGAALSEFFPIAPDDTNELPNTISHG